MTRHGGLSERSPANPEGDYEVYLVNADGSGQTNLSNNGGGVNDDSPEWGGQAKKK